MKKKSFTRTLNAFLYIGLFIFLLPYSLDSFSKVPDFTGTTEFYEVKVMLVTGK